MRDGVLLLEACKSLNLLRHLVSSFTVEHVSFLGQDVLRLGCVVDSKQGLLSRFLLLFLSERVGDALTGWVFEQDLHVIHTSAHVVVLLFNGSELLGLSHQINYSLFILLLDIRNFGSSVGRLRVVGGRGLALVVQVALLFDLLLSFACLAVATLSRNWA